MGRTRRRFAVKTRVSAVSHHDAELTIIFARRRHDHRVGFRRACAATPADETFDAVISAAKAILGD